MKKKLFIGVSIATLTILCGFTAGALMNQEPEQLDKKVEFTVESENATAVSKTVQAEEVAEPVEDTTLQAEVSQTPSTEPTEPVMTYEQEYAETLDYINLWFEGDTAYTIRRAFYTSPRAFINHRDESVRICLTIIENTPRTEVNRIQGKIQLELQPLN